MRRPADPSVFEDSDRGPIHISESELLGTHRYENVLYTGSVDVVDATTGETPDELDRSIEDAEDFAQRTYSAGDLSRVATKSRQPIESRSPYVSSLFCNHTITGGMDWHTVFFAGVEII